MLFRSGTTANGEQVHGKCSPSDGAAVDGRGFFQCAMNGDTSLPQNSRSNAAPTSVTRLMVTSIFGTASLTLFALSSARKPSVDPDENGLKSSLALVM